MPLYHVTEDNQPDRLVDAASGSAAIRYVTKPRVKAEAISNPLKVAELMEAGLKLERAAGDGEEPAVNAG